MIAFVNEKGGVGKTTAAFHCASGLARHNLRVLAVDLDMQANLTQSFGYRENLDAPSVYQWLKQDIPFEALVHSYGPLHFLPSNRKLLLAETEFMGEAGREYKLKRVLKPILDRYDYILLDCPPKPGLLTLNGLTAATDILIVVRPDNFSIQGTADFWKTLDTVKDILNPEVNVLGILLNGYDTRNGLDRECLAYFRSRFESLMFPVIRRNVALSEATGKHQDIFTYRPESAGAEDFDRFTKEMLTR